LFEESFGGLTTEEEILAFGSRRVTEMYQYDDEVNAQTGFSFLSRK
jgi:hypothetical protein